MTSRWSDRPVSEARGPRIRVPGSDQPWLTVSAPLLPELDALIPSLREIWDRRWVTNQGPVVRALETRLVDVLGAEDVAVVTNGTVAIDLALRALVDGGEVIVPAYSFPATWSLAASDPRYTPVFVDVREDGNVDPDAVRAAITPRTTAIVGVHAYGRPADHEGLAALAASHGLALLYDAAHAFAVEVDGVGIGAWGDLSTFSFHATKVFNTLEGGAVSGARARVERVALLRGFGIGPDGVQHVVSGNGKMDEVRACIGLATLPLLSDAMAVRAGVAARYRAAFDALDLHGLHVWPDVAPNVRWNHAYFPVRIAPPPHGPGRDAVEVALRARGILARRYFTDTVGDSPIYAGRFDPAQLPWTRRLGREVLCLPIHHLMGPGDVDDVVAAFVDAWR